MNDPEDIHPKIHAALNLDGNPENVRRYYEEWALKYDADVADEAYAAPQISVQLFLESVGHPANQIDFSQKTIPILDAGCGTGLVGLHLFRSGYHNLEGCDLSPAMVARANAREIYRQLLANVNLNEDRDAYPAETFDVMFCCGVFTLGHVLPHALEILARWTCPGGLLIMSTRAGYYDTSDFQANTDRLIKDGILTVRQTLWDAPYTSDSQAHYWVFEVS